jgi:uracil-DNA glycosylase
VLGKDDSDVEDGPKSQLRQEMSVAKADPLRETDWGRLLQGEFGQSYWAGLTAFVERQRPRYPVYPAADEVFHALELTPCERTKVVMVGQDPYHGPGQAHGLCFSVPCGVKPPPSLVNIMRELETDCGVTTRDHGNLEAWAKRGVLLLNTTLTVRGSKARSHSGRGWETFTDAVIRIVTEQSGPVFLLWGKDAQRKEALITRIGGSPDKIFKSSHPSPISAYRPCGDSPPFFGSKPFSRANKVLGRSKRIDWTLPPCL